MKQKGENMNEGGEGRGSHEKNLITVHVHACHDISSLLSRRYDL